MTIPEDSSGAAGNDFPESAAAWRELVAKFQRPSIPRASWQVVNSLGSYVLVWALMYFSGRISEWLTVPLVLLAAALLVRVFIIFHDCGHGSFLASRRANAVLGFFTGLLTFTPYRYWHWEHALHHATAGDLDRRGTGDVWTLTVQEYLESTRWRKFAYRVARNPVVLFVIAPLLLFLVWQRFPSAKAGSAERRSVWWTNVAVVAMVGGMGWLYGFERYAILQLAVMGLGGAAGIWLFYVQHQFEGVSWERRPEWDFVGAALEGSSFYRLPRVLQWFSGNIGFHHVHHLSPRIPNYNLERCHNAVTHLQQVKPITLFSSLRSLGYRLWDEKGGRLVGFGHLRRLAAQRAVR